MNVPTFQVLSKPTQAHGRFAYETGASSAQDGIIPAANAFEQASLVMGAPCLVSSIEALAIETGAAPVYLLGFDVVANDVNLQLIIAGAMGGARYTWGPMNPGATLVREAEEVFPSRTAPFYPALPLDRGLIIVASATPRLWTAPGAGQQYSVLVRGTTREGC